jgi:hypothetical protein
MKAIVAARDLLMLAISRKKHPRGPKVRLRIGRWGACDFEAGCVRQSTIVQSDVLDVVQVAKAEEDVALQLSRAGVRFGVDTQQSTWLTGIG